jgi:hypothetical protein
MRWVEHVEVNQVAEDEDGNPIEEAYKLLVCTEVEGYLAVITLGDPTRFPYWVERVPGEGLIFATGAAADLDDAKAHVETLILSEIEQVLLFEGKLDPAVDIEDR